MVTAGPTPTTTRRRLRLLPLLLLLMATTIPRASSAAAPRTTTGSSISRGRRGGPPPLLPPWVSRTRGGANQEAGDGEYPAAVLRKEEFELVEEDDRYRGRWRSILKVRFVGFLGGLTSSVVCVGGGCWDLIFAGTIALTYLWQREVRYPDGRLVDFDVMDQVCMCIDRYRLDAY